MCQWGVQVEGSGLLYASKPFFEYAVQVHQRLAEFVHTVCGHSFPREIVVSFCTFMEEDDETEFDLIRAVAVSAEQSQFDVLMLHNFLIEKFAKIFFKDHLVQYSTPKQGSVAFRSDIAAAKCKKPKC